MTDLLFDTCFLIDLEREMRVGGGPCHEFLRGHASSRPWISCTVAGEFAEGFADMAEPPCAGLLGRFEFLAHTPETAAHYATITRKLRRARQLIGTNDLWIVACAMQHSMPLVTRNLHEFARIPGLNLVTY